MEHEIDNASSSEESLILSQETFRHVFDEFKETKLEDLYGSIINEVAVTETTDEQPYLPLDSSRLNVEPTVERTPREESFLELTNVLTSELIVPDSTQPEPLHNKPSSLPGTENWAGAYGFNVSFGLQDDVSKNIPWIYSPEKNKLYVRKDAACPINFSTSCEMPDDTSIRAMPLFCSPQHASNLVHRCYNHALEDEKNDVPEAEHLVRCESDIVAYEVDPPTRRQSVVVPFNNPAAGQQYSTYIYKFVCFGSCSGGPNRRPLMIVFTLEKERQVLGRQKFDLKICACPVRDRMKEEKLERCSIPLKRKESNISNLSNAFSFLESVDYPIAKKPKQEPNEDGCYEIAVKDRSMYEFLKHMKHFYEMCEMMKRAPPAITNQLFQLFIKIKNKKEDSD